MARQPAGRQMGLVEEDGTRLIADLVAGKLDVREAAAQLPDHTENQGRVEEEQAIAEEVRI